VARERVCARIQVSGKFKRLANSGESMISFCIQSTLAAIRIVRATRVSKVLQCAVTRHLEAYLGHSPGDSSLALASRTEFFSLLCRSQAIAVNPDRKAFPNQHDPRFTARCRALNTEIFSVFA
jgi:hypothetical protein